MPDGERRKRREVVPRNRLFQPGTVNKQYLIYYTYMLYMYNITLPCPWQGAKFASICEIVLGAGQSWRDSAAAAVVIE
jgi:hypothetical protein